MLDEALKALGKSLLILTGVGYGVVKALEAFPPASSAASSATPAAAPANAPDPRLDAIEQRLAQLESSHADFSIELDRRFLNQDHAIQSLRAMVARTDELMEQVIENIESMHVGA